jgi:hypothetical protein
LGLGLVHAEGFTPDEKGGGSLEEVTVVEGVLNHVDLEASTTGGDFFSKKLFWRLVRRFP